MGDPTSAFFDFTQMVAQAGPSTNTSITRPIPVAELHQRIEQLEQRVAALEKFHAQTQQSWGAVVLAASNSAVRALGDARKAPGDQP